MHNKTDNEAIIVNCTNPMGQWGSVLSPPLNDINRELHSPRPNYNANNQYYY